jgi:hypothetical protein
MDTKPQGQETKQAPATGPSHIDEAARSRRALLKMGVGASPVLLTLASGPAAAQACIVASVYMSADTFASRFHGQTLQCGSPMTPYAWVAGRGAAPGTGNYLLMVSDVLGPVSSTADAVWYNDKTLHTIFGSEYNNGHYGVLQLLLALQLAGNPGLPGDYAKTIWQNYAGVNGLTSYTATGISWPTYELYAYLKRLVDPSVP